MDRPITERKEDQRELLSRALGAVKDLRSRLAAQEQRSAEPIAIIGLGCRFPGGADSPDAFWSLLESGANAVSEIPESRFPVADLYDPNPDTPGKIAIRRAGFLPEIDRFDAEFFGISAREAVQMDPQQRLSLEVAWEALEDAGQTLAGLSRTATGVFMGAIATDYAWRQLDDVACIDAYSGTGTHSSLVSGRLSYFLDLRGPSLTLDSACSSSLVAVHLACQSLRLRECNLALAGGVNVVTSPVSLMAYSRMGLLAPDGRCKTFDSRADGFVPGEGCGVVVLKRLSNALADRDDIRAVIRGSAVNQDGRSSTLTAPNGPSQVDVISRALASAGIPASRVSCIEAHGTGTALGDPIEIEALRSVLDGAADAAPCAVGSVKTNIGHLGAGAGVAGLIKVVLSLQHERIPRHLNFIRLSPHISLDRSRLFVPVDPLDWKDSCGPLTAGVSSFGWSGTNAHVVVERAPALAAQASDGSSAAETYLLPLSARSPGALTALGAAYAKTLAREELADPVALRDLCHTAGVRRSHHKLRAAVTGNSASELIGKLNDIPPAGQAENLLARGVAFVFCGQGALSPGAGHDLYRREEVFRASLDETDAAVRRLAGWSILEKLAPAADPQELDNTRFAQPALFALQVALSRLWQAWGIEPSAIVGHSAGEIAAAHLAGILTLESAVNVVVNRASRMQFATGLGATAEVELTPDQARDVIQERPGLAIAAYNSPGSVVLAGTPGEVSAVVRYLESRGVRCTPLRPKYAFHSAQMDPCVEPLIRDLQGLKPGTAAMPFYSTVHGGAAADGDFTASYWGRNLRQPVLFSAAIRNMIEDGYRTYLEIGPHPVLSPSISRSFEAARRECAVLPSLHRKRNGPACMLESLGSLYSAGANVRFRNVSGGEFRPPPPYPWQRKRYWLDVTKAEPAPLAHTAEIGCYDIAWDRFDTCPASALNPAAARKNWLLFETEASGQSGTLADALAGRIIAAGACCRRAALGTSLEAAFEDLQGEWNVLLVCPAQAVPESAASLAGQALRLAQACLESPRQIQLWFVTRGAQPPNAGSNPAGLAHSPLIGLGRTLAVESPYVWGGLIDAAPGHACHPDSILACIASAVSANEFAINATGTFVPNLSRSAPAPGSERLLVRSDRSYLITGGLGGVALAIARALVAAGARHLTLLGRGEPSAAAAHTIKELRELGVSCTVCRADVSERSSLAEAVSVFGVALPPLSGVVHAAGVLRDGVIPSIVPAELPELLAAKTAGAWNLHETAGQLPLDFFVLCSSLTSVLGSAGQGSYSTANAFLDRLAYYRQALGLCGLTINWGPWADTGMTARPGNSVPSRWADQGIASFSANRGAEMFLRIAATSATQRCAAIVDWPLFRRSREGASPITATLAAPASVEEPPAPHEEPQLDLRTWMHRKVADILKVGQTEVSLERNLLELGFDSLMVMELLRAVLQRFQLRTYPREFYQQPSVAAFSSYLSGETAPRSEAPEPAAAAPSKGSYPVPGPARTSGKLDIPVVFVLSAPRSGSTLLRVMLAGHPGLFCPPELHLLGFSTMRERRSALAGSYLQEGLLRAVQELSGGSAEEAKALEDKWVSADLTVQAVYARLHEMAGGRLLVDKSPPYAASPSTLRNAEELFSSARYIHLVRHPLAVIDSFVKNRFDRLLGLTGKPPRDTAEAIWVEGNANVSAFFPSVGPGRTTTVRYEDLVQTPGDVMRNLCSFLALPFDDAVLTPYEGARMTDGLKAQSIGIGDPGFLNHQGIDASLADAWRKASGAGTLGHGARTLAATFKYELPPAPPASVGMAEQRIAVRGLSLCLCSWGPPDGHPVLILHGALDHGAAWDEVARALAGSGFRVFAPDQRGHGHSQHAGPGGSYYLMDFLADADTLLHQVTASPVLLAGHSMGASLAALLTAARPSLVSQLVLVEPVLTPARGNRSSSELLTAHLNGIEWEGKPQTLPDPQAASQRLREFHPALSAAQAEKMAARLLEPCPGGFRWRWDERIRSLAGIAYHGTSDLDSQRFLSILSELQVPVTLVRGQTSELVPLEHAAMQMEVLRDGREVVLPGGHNLHLDCPLELAGIIEAAARRSKPC